MPEQMGTQLADFHRRFWTMIFETRIDHTPDPIFLVLFRGGGKSQSAEAAVTFLGVTGRRKYGLYVSGTQSLADDHLDSIAESVASNPFLQAFYPDAMPHIERVSTGRGKSVWRRNRLVFGNGFTVDARGLDTQIRGAKRGINRLDCVVIDDVDVESDSKLVTKTKMDRVTSTILPAAAASGALVIGSQNLVKRNSVFDQLTRPNSKVMTDKRVIGPVPLVWASGWARTAAAVPSMRMLRPACTPLTRGLHSAQRNTAPSLRRPQHDRSTSRIPGDHPTRTTPRPLTPHQHC